MAHVFCFEVWSYREAYSLQTGTMYNSFDELLILRNLRVSSIVAKAPKIIPVALMAPSPGWIELNDGAVAGNTEWAGCGGIFRTSRGFIKRCFASPPGVLLAHEAEIWVVIIALDLARQYN